MFRIHFDPTTGQFVVQVLSFGCFWTTVRRKRADEPTAKIAGFATYEEAGKYVSSIGLDKLYTNKSADKFRAHMAQA